MKTKVNWHGLVVLGIILVQIQVSFAASITRAPYLQQVTETSAVVRFRTDMAVPGEVRYGTNPTSLAQSATGPATTEHEIRVTGLTRDTRSFYEVHAGGQLILAASPNRYIQTMPAAGTPGDYRVWIIGDSGTANADARAVRDAYRAHSGTRHTDVWLMLGDNAYSTGTDDQYSLAVFDMYTELLPKTSVWPTIGNHDRTGSVYQDTFTLPELGEAGGLVSGTENYYSFDHGNIHFVCLDSYTGDLVAPSPMLDWLANDLSSTTEEWIIAYFHHPPYTKGSHDSDNDADSGGRLRDVRENVIPILEAHGVDLVLSGHSHSYERSYYINGHYGDSSTFDPASMLVDGGDGDPVNGDGAYVRNQPATVYAVAGSSGKVTGTLTQHPVMAAPIYSLGSLVLDIRTNVLDGVFIDEAGTERDHFRIVHPGSPPVLTQNPSASGISQTAANLLGTLVNDGLLPTTVTLYLGTLDGGTTPIAWSQQFHLGPQSVGPLTAAVTSLQPSTTYFFRFAATNADGQVFASPTESFTTLDPPPPQTAPPAITQNPSASGITQTAANLAATLLDDGLLATTVTLYLGTSDGGTTPGAWSQQVSLGPQPVGPLTVALTSLQPSTTYFFRFAASNADGQIFASSTESFTTQPPTSPPTITQNPSASGITQTAATLAGTLVDDGLLATTVTLFLGTSDGGTIPSAWSQQLDLGPQSVGPLTAALTSLQPATSYFFRFAASNADGQAFASSTESFTTLPPPTAPPTITQNPSASGITQTAATLAGTLVDDGLLATSVTLYWGTSDGGATPGAWSQQLNIGPQSVGPLTASLANLQPATLYFFRFAASNADGQIFASPSGSFTSASPPTAPPLIAQNPNATAITQTSATLSGTLLDDGNLPTEVILYYGSTDALTLAANWENRQPLGISATGTVTRTLTGLLPGTTYFFRFRAVNDLGQRWGSPTAHFTTLSSQPPPTDGDNDGLLDSWEEAYFGNTTSTDGTTDSDADGFTDREEFQLGSVPTDATSNLRITQLLLPSGRQITWTAQADRRYVLEATTDLEATAWTVLQSGIGSGTFLDNSPALPLRHYRVRLDP